jgi:hypothetical protein
MNVRVGKGFSISTPGNKKLSFVVRGVFGLWDVRILRVGATHSQQHAGYKSDLGYFHSVKIKR